MPSHNEKQTRLLLKAYLTEAQRTLDRMESALNRGDVRKGASMGLYELVPTLRNCIRVKADLRQIRQRQAETRKQAKYNIYPGGSLYTG